MKNVFSLVLALVFLNSDALASATRTVTADQIMSSDLSKNFFFPSASDTLLGQTLSSTKLYIGNGSNIATGIFASGDITNDNAGVFTIGAKKVQASKLDSGAAASGSVATADGAGGVTYGVNNGAPPAISGSKAAPNTYASSGNISQFSATNYNNRIFVAGSASAVNGITITACAKSGQELILIGESATNTVTIADSLNVSQNGPITLGLNSVISYICDVDAGVWVERSRR